MFTAQEVSKNHDFVEDLEQKFAALSPDVLPTLQSYLQDSHLSNNRSENGTITPSPSSGVNKSIPHRTGPNSSQILHYESENFKQDQVLKSAKKKASLSSSETYVQGLKTDENIEDSESTRSDLSNGTTLTPIATLQAELQAAEEAQPRLKNFKSPLKNLPEHKRLTASTAIPVREEPPLNALLTDYKKEPVKKVHWFTYNNKNNNHQVRPDVQIREQLPGSPGSGDVTLSPGHQRTSGIGPYGSLVQGPLTVVENFSRTSSTATVTKNGGRI